MRETRIRFKVLPIQGITVPLPFSLINVKIILPLSPKFIILSIFFPKINFYYSILIKLISKRIKYTLQAKIIFHKKINFFIKRSKIYKIIHTHHIFSILADTHYTCVALSMSFPRYA